MRGPAAHRPPIRSAVASGASCFRVLNGRANTLVNMPLRYLAPLLILPALLFGCSDRDSSAGDPTATTSVPGATARATAPSASPTNISNNGPAAQATAPAAKVAGPAEHDIERTVAHVRTLTETIGTRVSGTEGEDKAVDYIAGHFESLGYDVEIMPFEFATGGYVDDSLRAGDAEIASRRFNGSGTTEISGQGVFVGLADAAGLAGKSLTGKIAIADRGTLTFTDKYTAVKAAGAVGLIVINTEDGLFAGRIDPAVSGPAIGVSRADRDRILAAATAGETFTVSVPGFAAKNVIARPSAGAECRVLVGGHHDSVPGTAGAGDNASGTATVLELARAFAVDGLDEGLCFATFGGEESGLHGSAALANKLRADGLLPAVYVNLDVTGTGNEIEAIGDAVLTAEAVETASALGMTARATSEPAGTSSDHASFRRVGVPVIFLASDDYSNIHTPGDTLSTFNLDLLDEIGDLAYDLITEYQLRFARG